MATTWAFPPSSIPDLAVIDLVPDGGDKLQEFFEVNPFYFLAVHGQPAQPREAHEEIAEDPPSGWPFTRKYVFGYQRPDGQLAAMAHVISDLLAEGVWHVATFIVETARHGTGDSQALYQSLEKWAKDQGAQWMRLGVVQGHTRAESFWLARGYRQVASRQGVEMGLRVNDLRVMVKPLHNQTLSEYYAIVERDRPPSTNAA